MEAGRWRSVDMFADAWLEVHPLAILEHSWTYTTLEPSPKKRIDFVLYRGDLEVVEVRTVGDGKPPPLDQNVDAPPTTLLFAEEEEETADVLYASDHKGVLAVLKSRRSSS